MLILGGFFVFFCFSLLETVRSYGILKFYNDVPYFGSLIIIVLLRPI